MIWVSQDMVCEKRQDYGAYFVLFDSLSSCGFEISELLCYLQRVCGHYGIIRIAAFLCPRRTQNLPGIQNVGKTLFQAEAHEQTC